MKEVYHHFHCVEFTDTYHPEKCFDAYQDWLDKNRTVTIDEKFWSRISSSAYCLTIIYHIPK